LDSTGYPSNQFQQLNPTPI
jgi:DNA-binding XRE family transcriptional regulator